MAQDRSKRCPGSFKHIPGLRSQETRYQVNCPDCGLVVNLRKDSRRVRCVVPLHHRAVPDPMSSYFSKPNGSY